MAAGSSRVIARIVSTHSSEYASMTRECIVRADGQVCYRLTGRQDRRERNLPPVTTIEPGGYLHLLPGPPRVEPVRAASTREAIGL
jgi:hypothetical protein